MTLVRILRENDRNTSYCAEWQDKDIFLKDIRTDLTPSEEYQIWQRYRKVSKDMIPQCLFFDDDKKQIAYEWLSGYAPINDGYSQENLDLILQFLKKNALVNSYKKLCANDVIVQCSRKKRRAQINTFLSYADKAVRLFVEQGYDFPFSGFLLSLSYFCYEETLCHCDMGRSNILWNGKSIKLVDYEYSMFSRKELDYGRLYSTVFLLMRDGVLDNSTYEKLSLQIVERNKINCEYFSKLAGLQLLMRLVNNFEAKKQVDTVQLNLINKLLSENKVSKNTLLNIIFFPNT